MRQARASRLRRLGCALDRFPLTRNALVDDTEACVPANQPHRWIRVAKFADPGKADRGLAAARAELAALFDLED